MQIQIEKPRLGVPASLIVDDPTPCINPLYYFRLQVDRHSEIPFEQLIPLEFLGQFIAVCRARGIRGKFSVIPYPAGLGSIVDGWPGCDELERRRWLELVRDEVAPDFDITPEILTHTLALDIRTRRMLPEPEHDWMAGRTREELTHYFGASLALLREAGFSPSGITQPCYFHGSRDDYNHAVLDAMRAHGGPPVTFYFIDFYLEGAPFPDPEVVLLDRERGEAVVDIPTYTDDYFWHTQRPPLLNAATAADRFLTADGRAGRLAEVADGHGWLIFVCHWQTLYSDGTREGLQALDEVAARLRRVHGPRLHWMTLGEIARYRAASEGWSMTVEQSTDGVRVKLDSAFDCPDFTISVGTIDTSAAVTGVQVVQLGDAPNMELRRSTQGADRLLEPSSWREENDRIAVCFDLQRGSQVLTIQNGASRNISA